MDFIESFEQKSFEKLQTDGYLLLVLPEIARESIRATFDSARRFFLEELDEKTKYSFFQEMGYRPFGIEYSQSPTFPDQVESFTVSSRVSIPQKWLGSENVRILYERMTELFEILESLAEALTIQLANKLSGTGMGNNMKGAFRQWSRLQLNYSRPSEVVLPFINESHEDGNLFTFTCANQPGLELQVAKNEFKPITTALGEVLILPGEIAWLLSGGIISPLYHRVRPDRKINERMALLFFGDIDPKLCQPWILNETNREIEIGERVVSSVKRFGLKGFDLEGF
jgi:isopenicillin N synthase-like dioxygenase